MYLVYDRIANDSIPHTCLKMVLSTYFHVSFQSFSHRNCMTGSRHLSCSFWLYFDVTMYTAISRKVVRKNVHATIPKGDVGYDHYTVPVVPDTVAIESTFVAFL